MNGYLRTTVQIVEGLRLFTPENPKKHILRTTVQIVEGLRHYKYEVEAPTSLEPLSRL